MLLFRSEEHVTRWCKVRGWSERPLVLIGQLWQLSVAWYGNRLTPASRRPIGEEVTKIFSRIGLTGEFWEV